jgi:hypothetical protein
MIKFKSIYMAIALVLIIASCEYNLDDVNPPRPLDGPAGIAATPTGDTFTATDTSDDTWTYVHKGGVITFNIDIVDAPGLISAINVTLANSVQPEDLGTVVTSLGTAEGNSVGTVSVTYTAGNVAGEEEITIVVSDGQDPAKSLTFTYPTIKVVDTDCFTDQLLTGFYDTVTDGHDSSSGLDFTGLAATVEIYMRSDNHPGKYRFTDGSFGLYPEQGKNNNFIHVYMCDNQVLDADEEFAGNYTGTITADGVITITWSNTYGDSGVTVMTPQ